MGSMLCHHGIAVGPDGRDDSSHIPSFEKEHTADIHGFLTSLSSQLRLW